MLVVIRGAGDLATGIALRLHRAGYQIVMTDLPAPTSIRRTVCFSEAIRLGEMTVEDISARKAETPEEALTLAQSGVVAVLADPAGACIPTLRPGAVVERRPIVDEAPTYAQILGVELPWADGSPISEILR